jgi:hypothetical protein
MAVCGGNTAREYTEQVCSVRTALDSVTAAAAAAVSAIQPATEKLFFNWCLSIFQ